MKSSASPDNLGALFTHDGIAETIYSTSTVHVNTEGTTTIDYWAVIPSSQEILHAPRDVVVHEAANDNATIAPTDASTTPPANDNLTLPILMATGTDPTITANSGLGQCTAHSRIDAKFALETSLRPSRAVSQLGLATCPKAGRGAERDRRD